MKPLVIYHADCTDGFAAAFAAWLKLGDEAEYLPMQYGFKFDWEAACAPIDVLDREVYILDFSFERNVMEWIFEKAKRVVWLDHHKTAFEMWCGEMRDTPYSEGLLGDRVQHDNGSVVVLHPEKSGALIAWDYFHTIGGGPLAPALIRHIDDRDRWQFKLDGSKELHAALQSYKPWSFEQWKRMFMVGEPFFVDEEVDWFAQHGEHILRAQDQHVQQMVKHARKCDLAGGNPEFEQIGLAVNASLHQSEVGHELANTSGTFGLVWYLGNDNRVRCSLRSNGEYDVSAIAKSFGGGGHRNAAGFETDVATLMGWLR